MGSLGIIEGRIVRDSLSRMATGRETSRFAADVAKSHDRIRDAVAGKRVLVIGGAGSIGSSTVRALLPVGPAAVDVMDQSENGLAELVRDVRSDGLIAKSTAFRCLPIDYGSSVARRFVLGAGRYDVVMHFAALKHVRSEKDATSVLQMFDTNVLKQRKLMQWLDASGSMDRYFAVSTDKAANPVNFMGASKRLMEHLLFTPGLTGGGSRTSARFANVAFSAGSLLASWRDRMDKRQPLAVPRDTRRYFVSMAESAEICLLAALALPQAHLAVPRMTPESDLIELAPIAESFVRQSGFEPAWYESEAAARGGLALDIGGGRWPILLTPLDTDGEKSAEEFVGAGETAVDVGWSALRGIAQPGSERTALESVLDQLDAWVSHAELKVERHDVARVLAHVVPEFAHAASGKSLDERM